MEINGFKEVIGVIPQADVVEGRFGLLTSNAHSYDLGSRTDLPGFKVPATADEAEQARYIITWAMDNRSTPIYQPYPAYTWALRQGWDQAANLPMTSTTVYTTYPGYMNSYTIPSGTPALAYQGGTFTIPSGQYIYNAGLKNAGAFVVIANTAEDTTDAGKPKYQATSDDRVIGRVLFFNTSNSDLTIIVD